MPIECRATRATFTRVEVAEISGSPNCPLLPDHEADNDENVSLDATMASMVWSVAAAIGLPLSADVVMSCLPSLLWYALHQENALVDADGRDIAEAAPQGDHSDLIHQIAGVAPSRVGRFIHAPDKSEPELLSETLFHEAFDGAFPPPTDAGVRLVDIAALGLQLVERAGRPLVTVH